MPTYRVTKAIYHQGVYYEVGDVVENDGSLGRIFQWKKLVTPVEPEPDAGLGGLLKTDLLDLAHERGVEVPVGSLKDDILKLLEQ